MIAGLAPESGGPSYSVPRLCRALAETGCEPSLLTIGDPMRLGMLGAEAFAPLCKTPPFSTLRLSPALSRALRKRGPSVDVIHNHGLWLMPNVAAGHAARTARKPLIVSPRGMLAPEALEYSKLRKRAFWTVLQGPAFAKAAAWHATSEEEAGHIRAFGIRAPIAVIPNGIDIPAKTAAHADAAQRRKLLFLSRIHPKKGLRRLFEAWAIIAPERRDWDLLVVGPDEGGHRSELKRYLDVRDIPRVQFLGPLYGADKEDLIASADLFVLPTLSENFGIAVAEALAAGVPAIVTKGAPWQILESERSGWWIEHGVEALTAALREATGLPASERRAMGARARASMSAQLSWTRIARDITAVYAWMLGATAPPLCVMTEHCGR